MLISLSNSPVSKGDRLVVKDNGDYYVCRVTSVRGGKTHVIYDDDIKTSFPSKSKNILGHAINKRVRKSAIPIPELSKWVKVREASRNPKRGGAKAARNNVKRNVKTPVARHPAITALKITTSDMDIASPHPAKSPKHRRKLTKRKS